MWGYDQADEIDFEWPTQEDWATMSPDTKLESFEFDGVILGMVKVNLSNG